MIYYSHKRKRGHSNEQVKHKAYSEAPALKKEKESDHRMNQRQNRDDIESLLNKKEVGSKRDNR